MIRHVSALTALLALCLTVSARSGELSAQLKELTQHNPAHELVSVWIKLPPANNARQFKSSIAAQARLSGQADTREGRYRIAAHRLRESHARAQADLLAELAAMERSGQAAGVKPHWVTNIVEARVAVNQLDALAARHEVELILPVPQIHLVEPARPAPAPKAAALGSNLTLIKADSAWAAGYTGQGRVICSFDTGVEGAHPALINGWKGHDGDSAAAWFDPKDQESFPHVVTSGYSPNHGTHVTGLLVGHDEATGETTGVALDAKWIAAAVIDISGTSILDAFEWAADPDGDLNSIDDVPDVINHSWGVLDIGCANVFYDIIDNLEALGIVNIFAAGNEGATADAIRNPANDDRDSLTGFAVGAVNSTISPAEIWVNSSRGPSPCGGGFKPNVTAPGYAIRSTYPGSTYQFLSGTSMATPHVAGLVALLRQKNPNATVEQIKNAILTTAVDYGDPGKDNTFGWGVIDCMAALNALSSANNNPNIRVYAFDHPPISPGDTVIGTVVLQNIGNDVSGVSATLTNPDPSLAVLDSSLYFGAIVEGDTVRSS
ncbi:MAG: S8 family serine peptidase, partial [Candidatus Zixiibacteriota bacterium]